jgi:hypothetical protein
MDHHCGEPRAAEAALAALLVGSVAALTATGALALLARAEGRGPLQPINATSHIIHGSRAGTRREADLAHTLPGYAINHGASIFWALPFTLWLLGRPRRSAVETAAAAAVTAGLAGAIDYGLVPRRLTPGWEHALPRSSVAAGFAALGLGLFAGARALAALRDSRG